MPSSKVITLNQAALISKNLKNNKKKIVLAHGVFDVLHVGHIKHFSEIKKSHNVKLFVSITADKFVQRGPGRPYFNQFNRSEMLAGIGCVDYVCIVDEETALKAIKSIKPHVYFKGKDYNNILNQNLYKEIREVKKYGGEVSFTSTEKFSSSNILNTKFGILSDDAVKYLKYFKKKFSYNKIEELFESIKEKKILVIGETILDEYVSVKPLNKTPKENLISYNFIDKEVFLGGILAVTNNLVGFSNKITLLTLNSDNRVMKNYYKTKLKKVEKDLTIWEKDFRTIKKTRFIENSYSTKKVFELYSMDESQLKINQELKILKLLKKNIKSFDIIILNDFGHGFFTKKIIQLIEKEAKYLSINVQSNSGNTPFNLVTKYKKANFICIDRPEAILAVGQKNISLENLRLLLRKKINFDNICITDGRFGAWFFRGKKFHNVPVFNYKVVDTMGTGDAFFSIAGIVSRVESDPELAAFLGNVAGAIKLSIFGHSRSIESKDFLTFANSLLK